MIDELQYGEEVAAMVKRGKGKVSQPFDLHPRSTFTNARLSPFVILVLLVLHVVHVVHVLLVLLVAVLRDRIICGVFSCVGFQQEKGLACGSDALQPQQAYPFEMYFLPSY